MKKGKPKKLALVACMRKLLAILNDMVRNEQMWRNQDSGEKGSGGTVATRVLDASLTHRRLSYL